MWDQKSAQKHSVISDSDKKLFESSSGLDSGFLSGPQYSSDDIDLEDKSSADQQYFSSITPTTNAVQQQQTTLTTQSTINDTNQFKEKSSADNHSEFIDSGLCESTEQTPTTDPMILDGSLDLNLNEWFCGLNIKNATNNLDCENKKLSAMDTTTATATATKCKKTQALTPLWKICYMQDYDGDT